MCGSVKGNKVRVFEIVVIGFCCGDSSWLCLHCGWCIKQETMPEENCVWDNERGPFCLGGIFTKHQVNCFCIWSMNQTPFQICIQSHELNTGTCYQKMNWICANSTPKSNHKQWTVHTLKQPTKLLMQLIISFGAIQVLFLFSTHASSQLMQHHRTHSCFENHSKEDMLCQPKSFMYKIHWKNL